MSQPSNTFSLCTHFQEQKNALVIDCANKNKIIFVFSDCKASKTDYLQKAPSTSTSYCHWK